MTPLDWMRLGARAMRLAASADCGNHWESCMEEAMTGGGLSPTDKAALNAEAEAATKIDEQIKTTCEDSALGYAAYMGAEEDKALLAAEGVTSGWLYRKEAGVLSRKELYDLEHARAALSARSLEVE